MKLLILVLTISLLHVNAAGLSQTVTWSGKNVPLKKVLTVIKEQTGYYSFYNSKLLEKANAVSLTVSNMDVDAFLELCFKNQPLEYEIENRTIIILDKAVSPPLVTYLSAIDSTRKITGKITDEKGAPIEGATIMVAGTTIATAASSAGEFSITVPIGKTILTVSFVGYETAQVTVTNSAVLSISLKEKINSVDSVVVIGYGTQRKTDLTSAVASVKAKDFVQTAPRDPSQLIQGKVAGLSIVTPNADPSASSQILLRGISTLSQGAAPLILIDGVPSNIADVAPGDIESFDILKDGSAAAIYGTRGTNGVILITTKRAHGETAAMLEYSGNVNVQTVAKRQEFMSAAQYRELVAQGKPGARDYGGSTDWQKASFQTPVSQTSNVNLKGGNSNTNYNATLSYQTLEGLMTTSYNNTLTYRLQISHSMYNGKLKIDGNLLGFTRRNNSNINFSYAYQNALTYNPTDPVKDSVGNWTEHPNQNNYFNPLSIINETQGLIQASNFRPYGSVSILPFAGMTLKVFAQYDVYNQLDGYAESAQNLSSFLNGRNGYASRNAMRASNTLLEATAAYTKSAGINKFSILGGYSYLYNTSESFGASNYNFTNTYYSYNNLGDGLALSNGFAGISSYKNADLLLSTFGRATYNYDDKYLLNASLRYEASSKFGADHKWGAFPAVSAGWIISNEPFMKQLSKTMNTLKLRGGYGITGTTPVDDYLSLATLTYGSRFLNNGVWTPALSPNGVANPDLRWERKEEANIGLDLGFLTNRITATVDLYRRATKDLLWRYALPQPPYIATQVWANAGSIRNKGIEVSVTAQAISSKNFSWTSSANGSANRNKVITFSNDKFVQQGNYQNTGVTGEPIQTYTSRVAQGQPIGNFFGFKSIDVDADGNWIIEGSDGKPKPVAEASEEDKEVLGNGLPKYYVNWNNTFTYKKFTLEMNMRGAFGFQILNSARMFNAQPVSLSRGNVMTSTYDKVYGKTALNDKQSLYYVSYYIESGDYWKMGNVSLGYAFDVDGLKAIKNLYLYASASNLFTLTGYTGIDPEVNSIGLSPGVDDRIRYPSTRTFTLGVNARF